MSRVNILYIDLHGDKVFGAEQSLFELVTNFNDSNTNFKPYVIVPEDGDFSKRLRECGVHVFVVPMPKLFCPKKELSNPIKMLKICLWSLVASLKIIYIIIKFKICILHVNNSNNINVVLPKLITNRPLVWHLRDILEPSRPWIKFLNKMVSIFSTRIIVISNSVASVLDGKFSNKIVKIYNPISFERFNSQTDGSEIREDLKLDSNQFVIGTVATVCPEKGIEEFIKAARVVLEKYPNTVFLVCGHGTESDSDFYQKLKKLIKELNIQENIIFLNFRSDIDKVIKALDVFVLVSWNEPLGRAAMEAMSCGKPIVVSNSGGLSEIVTDKVTGLLIEPHNCQDISEKIIELLSDVSLRHNLGQAALSYAKKNFPVELHITAVMSVYANIMKK